VTSTYILCCITLGHARATMLFACTVSVNRVITFCIL